MDSFISKEVSDHYPFVIEPSTTGTKNFKVEAESLVDLSIKKSDPISKRPTNDIRSPDTSNTLFCDACGRSFKSKKSFLSHMYQSHPNESTLYKFQCPHCSKKFHYQFLLNKHIKISHSKNSFKCQECNNLYQSFKALRLHQRKKHS